MTMSRGLRTALLAFTVLVLLVVYTPLALVVLNSFNVDRTFTWPPPDLTLKWWDAAFHSKGARSALWTSVEVALAATAVALVLGTLAGLALRKTRFFGRNVVSLVILLPIALPGIVTGIALSNAFTTVLGVGLSLFTIVVAHATFCIVTVFNNVQARVQRLGTNLEQASMDLGAGRWTTFRQPRRGADWRPLTGSGGQAGSAIRRWRRRPRRPRRRPPRAARRRSRAG